jgi:uncharacterized membrane protein
MTLGCGTPVAPADDLAADASVRAGAAPAYRRIDLGTLGGAGAMPFDVNDVGIVVGTSDVATGVEGRPFIWTQDAGMRALGDFPGTATAVSQRSAVVGVGRLDSQVLGGHAFLGRERAAATDLGVIRAAAGDYSIANDVNAQDEVAGTDGSGSYQAFFWSRARGLVAIPASGESQAFAINDRSEVAASESRSGTIPIQPFVWRPGGPRTDIPVPAGLNAAKPDDINNQGAVAGDYSFPDAANNVHGFVWSGSTGFESFGFSGNASTVPVAINERGEVLGNFAQLDTGRFGAFLWTKAGGLVDLTSRLGEHAVAFGFNNLGWIVGIQYETLDPVVWRAVLWIPELGHPNQSVAARPSPNVVAIDPATKTALLRCFTDPAVRGNKRAMAACATGAAR